MENIITSKELHFHYNNDYDDKQPVKEVLKGLNIDIKKGEFVAVLGHNGSGKSTFAKHLNGILLPCSGKVYVAGIDTADDERLFELRQHAGMVFQNPDNQIVSSIVEEDVAFALENLGVPYEEMRQRVDDALKAVQMYEYRKHSPSQLSGGQKQRVAIAGIIAMRPDCIILDEPTAMLDPQGRKEVLKTIRRLNKENGITIVLITHYMDEAAKSDRVIVMDSGKVVFDDVPKEVFSHVEQLKAIGLDVPQTTELAYLLRQNGIDIDSHIISEEECIDALEKLLKG
ncbi:MAG: energy-coupling factor transporter ATPase [Ruminococcus sp.]|nr:energy-coupling factor transporter ATPase [Ruminococcus sp.]MCI6889832.1 energy-coupling factor transporter ATPase [Ruminococcus sp.]MDD6634109.1 energy-coupling factor transporter ATPase [Ruminococcus sp.]MDY3213681.1 energy-coupling factor transporter ATPase [Ruminococcus sp.]CDF01510.1 cobalt transport protein ATP-binding subunit [Ruminococcus sp. CAG:624]